ncbi:MAG: AMFR protein [Lasallia pustulata]|uniref:Coupling of ubiquitin conjugation to ER degradation protein 1 n=1 Tax=Lasallia pustulata TaxID=136370 RepID=A0A5M8PS50_9LECA|nr:MAG: AMFR protein [Lasallia pustulata]
MDNTPPGASTSTLSLPSLLLLLVVAFLLLRYCFFSSAATGSGSQARDAYPAAGRGGRRGNAVDARSVEQVAQMFPQLGRREIAWDLVRNGGSVGATTERVLAGGGLDAPPPSFQPPLPHSPSSPSSASAAASTAPSHPNLITRYNLASKLNQSSLSTATEEGEAATKGKT